MTNLQVWLPLSLYRGPPVTQVTESKRKRVSTTIEVDGFTVLRSNNYTMADGISTLSGVRTGIAANRRRKRQVLLSRYSNGKMDF